MAAIPRCTIRNRGMQTHIFWCLCPHHCVRRPHHCLANSRTWHLRFPGPNSFSRTLQADPGHFTNTIPGLSKRRGNPDIHFDTHTIVNQLEVDSKVVGNASTRAHTYTQTDGQSEYIMPSATSTGWTAAWQIRTIHIVVKTINTPASQTNAYSTSTGHTIMSTQRSCLYTICIGNEITQ